MRYLNQSGHIDQMNILLAQQQNELEYQVSCREAADRDKGSTKAIRRNVENLMTSINGLQMAIDCTSKLK